MLALKIFLYEKKLIGSLMDIDLRPAVRRPAMCTTGQRMSHSKFSHGGASAYGVMGCRVTASHMVEHLLMV